METLSQTPWDVVICSTGLQQSLLALALSRSNKKVLHIDPNEYYGGGEAAFSLQEVDGWLEQVKSETAYSFRDASLWKPDAAGSNESDKLSFSRAYTLTLSPQIIYTRSKLLSRLVSSKVFRQLEFQAVGNWWLYDTQTTHQRLRRLPSGREDIFQDHGIDNKAKRSLMKFLKFVVDYENQTEIWENHAESGMPEFLSSQFQLPQHLQTVIIALTLSLDTPEETSVRFSLPRIARHLTSMGVFGPGFGAVFPKWGGGAEIAQVACRAGAVGGGVYVLGTGIKEAKTIAKEDSYDATPELQIALTNGERVKTKCLASIDEKAFGKANVVSRVIAVVSSPMTSLFTSFIEGSPTAGVSIVVFPPGSISVDNLHQTHPVYIMVHSNETGECPVGQCVLYATTRTGSNTKNLLEVAIDSFLKVAEDGQGKVLYRLYYEQAAPDETLDLAFNDAVLDNVEQEWRTIMRDEADRTPFMQFDERTGITDDDDEFGEGY